MSVFRKAYFDLVKRTFFSLKCCFFSEVIYEPVATESILEGVFAIIRNGYPCPTLDQILDNVEVPLPYPHAPRLRFFDFSILSQGTPISFHAIFLSGFLS